MGALQTIIDKQIALQTRLRADPELPGMKGMTLFDHLEYVGKAIMLEGAELLEWLPWKRHRRNYKQPLDGKTIKEIRIELIDIIHYAVYGLVECGLTTEDDILSEFLEKQAENNARQDQKY